MRRGLAVVITAASAAWAADARAVGLCDPQGHACVQIDATSGRLCLPLVPGGHGEDHCEPEDARTRDGARAIEGWTHGAMRAVAQAVVRFEDWTVIVTMMRRAAEAEVPDGGAREALSAFDRAFANARPAGWLVEQVEPPELRRIHGVQTARVVQRMSTAGVGGAFVARTVAFDVRTRDAAYLVTFDGNDRDAVRLEAFADASMATLDAQPVRTEGSAGQAVTWLLRAVMLAGTLAAIGVVLGRRRARGRGMDPRSLWPH